uniref:Extracellular Endonuclease subunit A domain-containing protein n=1 Tax=Panagrolaimus sp. PS1159 TaxID=55785 RepID=A0AC35G2S8_9BILA
EEVIDKFACPSDKSYRVFDRSSVPKRFHYASTPRVGDVILDGQKGTTFYPTKSSDYGVTSDHGYDYLDEEMHAIFFAHVPNNGTYGVLKPLLRDLNSVYPPKQFTVPVGICLSPNLAKNEVQNCVKDSQICERKKSAINAALDSCQIHQPPLSYFRSEMMKFCLIDSCSISLIDALGFRSSKQYSDGKSFGIFEILNSQEAEAAESRMKYGYNETDVDCDFILEKFDAECGIPYAQKRGVQKVSLLSNLNNDLKYLNRVKFVLFDTVVNGPFTYLQNLTIQYAKKYSQLIVITGTIYDSNNDGIADLPIPGASPTHIYRIIMRCEENAWNIDQHRCREESSTRVIAFVIPNQPKEKNCLEPLDYLLLNTARIKDIELLTGLHFFQEPSWYSESESLRIRTEITQTLWKL